MEKHGWALVLNKFSCLQNNDAIVLSAVEEEGRALEFASDRLKNDKTIVLAAVEQDPRALQCASTTLRDDSEVVLQAVEQDRLSFRHASDRLRNDREFIKEAVKLNHNAFHCVPPEALADEDFLVELVLLNPIRFGRSERITRDVALKLVRSGAVLIHLADEHWEDPEIVMESARTCGRTFSWASPTLRSDREFVLQAVRISGLALEGASRALKADPAIVLAAVTQDLEALMHTPLLDRHETILAAVEQQGLTLRHASADLRANRDICLVAVRQNGLALEFAAESLKCDREVVLAAVRNKGEAIQCARGAVRLDPHVLSASIRSSKSFKFPREETRKLVLSVISGVQQQHDREGVRAVSFQDTPNQVEGTAARNYAEQVWKGGLRHAIWLLQQKLRLRVDAGPTMSILEGCGINEELRLANELIRLSPIFAAFADRGINWNRILSVMPGAFFLDFTGI